MGQHAASGDGATPARRRAARVNRYALQRRLGFRWLRFAPELEREYQESFLFLKSARIRIVAIMAALAVFAFLLVDRYLGGQQLLSPAGTVLLVGIGVPAILSSLIVTLGDRFTPFLRATVTASFVTYGVALSLAIVLSREQQAAMPYESLILLTVGGYLLSGLSLGYAAFSGLTILAAYLVAILVVGVIPPLLVYEVFYLAIANLLSMVGLYALDYQARDSFLLSNELRQRSERDGLTGLMDRRAFRDRLQQAWRQAARDDVLLGVMLVDIDNFKQINDRHGHWVGDRVLQHIAGQFVACARHPLDAVCRYGGDEIIAMWFDTQEPDLRRIAGRVRGGLASFRVELYDCELDVQISGGAVLSRPATGPGMQTCVRLADDALHKAKQTGKNEIQFRRCDGEPLATS